MNVLVVTPTYNESENLPLLAAGVLKHDGFRLLVVDDGSPDGTGAIADQLAIDHPGHYAVMFDSSLVNSEDPDLVVHLGDYIYEGFIPASESGTYGFNVRVIPTYPHLLQAHELRLIAWA